MEDRPDISIIIVNYRVKEYISLLLDSIQKAKNELRLEIFVVDNNSNDDSVEYLSSLHKDIFFINNNDNKGFGKANNQAIQKATGTYTLLINPDTIIQEDSLSKLKNFMDNTEDSGAVGFKMLNPDGSFARECRRSVPDLKSGLFRVLGIDSLFSQNQFFGKRYLSWLDENKTNEVPVISGAGMFWRTSLLHSLNGFDESFFMYGEDDDLCYRVQETDYKIHYLPSARMLHFKGESERSLSFKNLQKINQGLIQFFNKHYYERYNSLSKTVISVAFYIRTVILYLILLVRERTDRVKKIESAYLVGSKKGSSLNLIDMVEISDLEITPKFVDIIEFSERPFINRDAINENAAIIFDTSSISFFKAFEIMESYNHRNLSFHFLMERQKLIIGKSTLIEL